MEETATWVEKMAATSPGAELFAQLEAVDPRGCTGSELVDLVDAHYRQVAYQQSRLLLTVRELAFAPRDDGRAVRTTIDGYADAEVAFALTVTDYGAGVLLSAAYRGGRQAAGPARGAGRRPGRPGQGQHADQ